MQKVTRAIYLVDDKEVVTVEIEATKVGNFASFVVDGDAKSPISTTPLTYRFTVALLPRNTHHGMISCFFPKAAPDDAFYQVFVSGSAGGGRLDGSDIAKANADWMRGIEFRRP